MSERLGREGETFKNKINLKSHYWKLRNEEIHRVSSLFKLQKSLKKFLEIKLEFVQDSVLTFNKDLKFDFMIKSKLDVVYFSYLILFLKFSEQKVCLFSCFFCRFNCVTSKNGSFDSAIFQTAQPRIINNLSMKTRAY